MRLFVQLTFLIAGIISNTATMVDDTNATMRKVFTRLPELNQRAAQPVIKQSPLQTFPDPIVTSDSASCSIPFSKAGNLIIIKAKVDSTEGNFILDTGAPHLILNLTYFRDYPATTDSHEEQGGITGDVASSPPTRVPNLSFGPIKYFNVDADRVNLGHIENSKGIKILGLLGLQIFKRFEMIIDYEKSIIYLHLITRKEKSISFHNPMLLDTSLYNTTTISLLENKLLVIAYMAGKKLTFVVDTGAESNVMDSRLPNKIFENINITRRVMLTGTGNVKIEALYGYMNNMMIANRDITTLPVLVTNLEKMCTAYNKCIDGMLGFDFLSLQKIGFNFVTHKMYIWK